MKKIVSLVLVISILMCAGNFAVYAESPSPYTADELAYVAYREINYVYFSSIRYLDVLGGLWESLLDADTWDDVDSGWLLEYVVADSDFDEGLQRMIFINRLLKDKFNSSYDPYTHSPLLDAIKEEATARKLTDPKATVFILLAWGEEVGYFSSTEELEASLENGMEAIRRIMSLDPNYTNLAALKDYYKEVHAIYTYMVDFSDNYINFTKKIEQYQESYDSWEIEFDFILGEDSYDTYGDAYDRFTREREAQKP